MSSNIQWKPYSLNQEIPVVIKNEVTHTSNKALFRSLPLKIYRKTLKLNNKSSVCNKYNVKISSFEIPGGAIKTSIKNNMNAPLYLVKQRDETCGVNPCPNPNSIQTNSLKRLRSNGMIKKNYFTSTKQYLNNRNISYTNQQYAILREGDEYALPGSVPAENNVYSTNGLPPSCNPSKKYSFNYYKPNNYQFSTEGAVSNSDYVTRIKYDTIRTIAASFGNVYGKQSTGSIAYYAPEYSYSEKEKMGYPLTCTPTFPKTSNTMVPCDSTTLNGIS